MPNAIVTGASSGLGRALTRSLLGRGFHVTVDARRAELLETELEAHPQLSKLPGDVTDHDHRLALVSAASRHGAIDLVINNASELGGSPPPRLAELDSATFARLWSTNVDAPLQLIRAALTQLAPDAVVINLSSDAAVEHYEGWGGYAATKAALDHLTLTLAVEHPKLRCYAVDPGDLRTPMHQAAFPGEDISDRPKPETVVEPLLSLITGRRPSGRHRASELVTEVAA